MGRGWRASIFAPNAMRPLDDSPSNLEKSDKKEIVAQAKRVIDRRAGSGNNSLRVKFSDRYSRRFTAGSRRGSTRAI